MNVRLRAVLSGHWRRIIQAARLAIGIPDYEAYVLHVRTQHPKDTPMCPEEFFKERMSARYGRGRSRCC